jgi:hypothetical protein
MLALLSIACSIAGTVLIWQGNQPATLTCIGCAVALLIGHHIVKAIEGRE